MANPQDGWIFKNLSESEARVLFLSLGARQKAAIRLWTEGWVDWEDTRHPSCRFLFIPRTETQRPPPFHLESKETDEITEVRMAAGGGDGRTLRYTENSIPHRARKHQRYDIHIPVVIQTASEQFRTQTQDVSEGGIRLRDPLPEQFAGYCQILLHFSDSDVFLLFGNPVEDQMKGRYHLEFVENGEFTKFADWLKLQSWPECG